MAVLQLAHTLTFSGERKQELSSTMSDCPLSSETSTLKYVAEWTNIDAYNSDQLKVKAERCLLNHKTEE